MGMCNPGSYKVAPSEIIKSNFTIKHMLGKGGFGETKREYALKEMSKIKLIKKKSVQCIMNERNLLAMLKHPLIINMHYAFEDKEKLYILTDLLVGGDLRYHMKKKVKFNEERLKFIVACSVAALEYMHTNGVVHRDIKPENMVFNKDGYVSITDLGISIIWTPENCIETSGTPGYMAPEVMAKQNHGIAVDYYGLGIVCYEIIMGKRPYSGKNRKEISEIVMKKQIEIAHSDIPKGWSLEAIDFVNHCIKRKPMNRLGFNGPEEVKEHPFLKDTNWKELLSKTLPAPFVPKPKKAVKIKPLSTTEEERKAKEREEEDMLLRRHSVQKLFNGYHYEIELEYKDLIEKESEGKKMVETMERIVKAKTIPTNVSLEANTKAEDTSAIRRQS